MNNKYTNSEVRKKWTDMIGSGLLSLLEIIKNIKLDEYEYDGPCNVQLIEDNEESTEQIKLNDVLELQTEKGATYELFGGICYDLLANDKNYKTTNKLNIIDNTGDIDVRIRLPNIKESSYKTNSKIKKFFETNPDRKTINSEYKSDTEQKINPYMTHFMNFVYSQLKGNINEEYINELFPKCDLINEADITTIFKDYDRTTSEFKYDVIGNSAILLYIREGDMLKIQLILKSGKVLDHVIEFVLLLTDNILSLDSELEDMSNKKQAVIISNGFIMQDIPSLLYDNYKAYLERVKYIDDDIYVHKVLNHVARMLYLLILLKKNPKILAKYKSALIPRTQNFISDILKSGKDYISFYHRNKEGKFTSKKIPITLLLTAFSKVFPKMYFTQILPESLNKKVSNTKDDDKEAYLKLIKLININSFNTSQETRKKKNRRNMSRHRSLSSTRNYTSKNSRNIKYKSI